MSRRRIASIAVAVALLAGAIVGGFVYGASKAPTRDEAIAQRTAAASKTFTVARLGAYGQGLNFGLETGGADGKLEGAQRGAADGRSAVREFTAARRDRRGGEKEAAVQLDGDGGVLVVGDSLEVLTIPYLQKYLPGVKLTTNAVGGYNSFQIFDLFQESYDPSQSVIVFDAGTNDNPSYPEILQGNLDKVASTVGNRCLVVPTIHGLSVDGVDSTAKNQVVRAFVRSRPGTQMPDWANAVASHPELMQADDLHPIAGGADLRAQLIAQGVEACLGTRGSGLGALSP